MGTRGARESAKEVCVLIMCVGLLFSYVSIKLMDLTVAIPLRPDVTTESQASETDELAHHIGDFMYVSPRAR